VQSCARQAPRVVAQLSGMQGVLHGLRFTYNRSPGDKERMFELWTRSRSPSRPAAGMLGG